MFRFKGLSNMKQNLNAETQRTQRVKSKTEIRCDVVKTLFSSSSLFFSVVLCALCVSVLGVGFFSPLTHAQTFSGIGRPATPAEVRAWDIDVRPDFKGLPPGKGSVAKGQEVWEAKCESCHGAFGESNEVFTPIVGGTSKADQKTGKVAALIDGQTPIRSTMMKVSTVSTLWDYINRAMPWNAPKTLTAEEVYASVAYILHLSDVVPADYVLSHENIAQVQDKLPNRNGKTLAHGMWNMKAAPDVRASLCMKDCVPASAQVKSTIPDYAKNAHGNLAEQTRSIGTRGIATGEGAQNSPTPQVAASPAVALANKHACTACHGMENKLVGPGFAEIRKKYADKSDALAYLTKKVKEGGGGVWGAIPMPPQPQLSDDESKLLAQWLAN
jgi:S-disulfanyl-L-cysteine oxidoreductase SoxD